EVRRGQTVTWKLTVELIPGWHTYPSKQAEAAAEQYVTEFQFAKASGPLVFVDPLREPEPLKKPEQDIKELRFYEGTTTWEQTAVSPAPARDWWTNHPAELEDVRTRLTEVEPATAPRSGLLALVLTGAVWGFVTLITPCVFPMIPITVSFFLKQGEKEHVSPLK